MKTLTAKEIRTILLLYKKLNYSNKAQIEGSVEFLEQRKMLVSPDAVLFKNRLAQLCNEDIPQDLSCVFCGDDCHDGKGLLCTSCRAKMSSKLKELNEESAQPEENTLPKEDVQPEENACHEESAQYEESVQPVEDITEEKNDDVAEKKLDSLKWVVLAGIVGIVLLVICGVLLAKPKKADASADVPSEPIELISFVGSDLETLEKQLGPSQATDVESIREFEDAGVSIIVNPKDNMVSYVDVDEAGDGTVKLFGLKCGMTREEVYGAFATHSIMKPSASENGNDYYFFEFDDKDFSVGLTIKYQDEVAVLISAMAINR